MKKQDVAVQFINNRVIMRDYDEKVFKDFGMVIYDECHHLGAEVFSRSLMKVNCKYTFNHHDGERCI